MLIFGKELVLNTRLAEVMAVHAVRCSLPYRRDRLFDLAADVERYPDFLPWWVAARVYKRERNVYFTDQVIRFATVRKRFGSKTVLQRPHQIDVTSNEGTIRNLHLTWRFDPDLENGCQVSLAIELELGSRFIEDLFAQALVHAVEPIVEAFETRAHHLFDPARGPGTRAG